MASKIQPVGFIASRLTIETIRQSLVIRCSTRNIVAKMLFQYMKHYGGVVNIPDQVDMDKVYDVVLTYVYICSFFYGLVLSLEHKIRLRYEEESRNVLPG